MGRKKKEVKIPGINKDGTIDKRYSKRKPLPTTADGFVQNKELTMRQEMQLELLNSMLKSAEAEFESIQKVISVLNHQIHDILDK